MMKNRQEKLKELLKEFLAICQKHNLKYVMFFGSLLGVIRHQNFIPWDDDLDLLIDYETYEFLIANYPNQIKSTENSDNFLMCLKWTNDLNNTEDALFIDLFVAVKTNKKQVKKYLSFKNKVRYLKGFSQRNFFKIQYGMKFLKVVCFWTKFFKKLQFLEVLKSLNNIDKPDCWFVPTWPFKKDAQKNIYDLKIDFFSVEKQFLDEIEVNVPKNSEKILEHYYGRNWRVPIKSTISEHLGLYDMKVFCKQNRSNHENNI